MAGLDVLRVKTKIEQLYTNKIDLSDYDKKPEEEKEKAFLSRGLAAYALHILASADIDSSANSIIDSFDDNGIDAVFFDQHQKKLWLVQSKWIDKGKGDPDTGDTRKFVGGVKDLIDSNYDRFGKKIKGKESDITDALRDASVQIELVITYTGQNLSTHNQRIINDLLDELNDTSELAHFQRFDLSATYKSIVEATTGSPITLEVVLSNWGHIEEPYKAYYGQIYASDIANWWLNHKRRLFSDNVRNFLGTTDVNKEIIDTIKQSPENLLYFNNGITVLCKKIAKKPLGGGDRNSGYFDCEGISVVNGAQTVACVGEAFEKPSEEMKRAKLFIRFISLENCPEDFDTKITIATNTQNKIEKRDFVSLDPRQEKLRIDLALEQITYHYKRTNEKPPENDENCDLEEATIALACATQDVNLAVQAKREIGKLWEDIAKSPYTDIFNDKVTATHLWRSIQVLRKVNSLLKNKELNSTGRTRSVYIHANRFILHLIFSTANKSVFHDPHFNFPEWHNNQLTLQLDSLIEKVRVLVEEKYPESLVHQVFRNFTKCKELKTLLLPQ